jgi:hypothetical protein
MRADDARSESTADVQHTDAALHESAAAHDPRHGTQPRPKRAGGNHTAVCSVRANAALDLGLEAGLAYLVAARGTGGDQRTTKWGANAIESREILGRVAAGRALAQLEREGLMTKPDGGKGRTYLRKLAEPVIVGKDAEGRPQRAPSIWYPNVLVDGVNGGKSPLATIRETRNPDVLRLLLRCYEHCDLARHSGIPLAMMRTEFTMKELGVRAEWRVFGLEIGRSISAREFGGPLLSSGPHEWDRFWTAWRMLEKLQLVVRVAYILDGPPGTGELLLPAGWGEDAEESHFGAMQEAARRLMTRTERSNRAKGDVLKGSTWFAVVPQHVQQPHAVLLYRPRYLPDTQPHRDWLRRLERWRDRAAAWEQLGS